MAVPPSSSPIASARKSQATSLGHFMSTQPAVKALLPPQTSPKAVNELLARFAANNFGILDDLQVRKRQNGKDGTVEYFCSWHCIDWFLGYFYWLSSNAVAAEQVCLGAGTYPRGALLNHSCAPNCVLVYEGTVQVWFIKKIRSNENVFVVLHAHLPHSCFSSIIRGNLSLSLFLC